MSGVPSRHHPILNSKYALFGILSFLDKAHIVRIKYLRPLNRRFQQLADSKEEEAFNMLAKVSKVFNFREYRQLEKLDYLSLSDFECGIVIPSTLFIRLPTHLRPYKQLKLRHGFAIDW